MLMRISAVLIATLIAHGVHAQAADTRAWRAIEAPESICMLAVRQDVSLEAIKGGELSVSLPPRMPGKRRRALG